MAKVNCFLYLERNDHPEIVENILENHTDHFERFSNNFYFYSGEKAEFSHQFIGLDEGIYHEITTAFKTHGIPINEKMVTGPADQCYWEKPDNV